MTFLQTVNIIKDISLAQPNVHTFKRDFLDLNNSEDIEYSAVVLQDRDSVIDRLNEQDWMTYTFHLGYVDRLTDDQSNRDHIISTGITVLTSVINSIRNTFGSELDVLTEDRIVTFDQRFTAQCAGVYLVLGIRLPLSDCIDEAQTDLYDTFEAKITENGQYHFVPDGKPVDEIDITVDVSDGRKPEESLEENIYSNGVYNYTPSEGSVFDSVTVNVSVPQSGKLETTFSVTPSTQDQTILPEPGYVFSSGVVSAVSADIDSNITSGNIRNGVEILGVTGTMNPQKTEVSLSERITSNGSYTYSPEEGEVFDSVAINVSVPSDRKMETTFSVTPSTQSQTITPDPGYVFSSGVVSAVTSSIDRNIAPWNIREGVTILGVTGTVYPQSHTTTFSVTPSKTEQTITPPLDYLFSSGTVAAVTSSIDSNIIPENIRQGVTILGVRGTLLTPQHITSGTFNITENGNYQYKAYGVYWDEADINVNVTSIVPKPANDEIYYVSYNGYTITPSDSSDFGATIVSNTVHRSGNYCVLKFDGNVTRTGYNSFRGSIRLKEIYLPDSVTVISQSSFQESGLQRCVMQDTITEIRGSAFDGCFALISPFRISKGCTSIGGSALRNCQALVTVTIPSSVTSINVRAFYGSSNIRDVIVQATTPPTLIQSSGNYTQFDGCTNLQRIRVPSGSVMAYKLAEGWGNWAGIIIADYE